MTDGETAPLCASCKKEQTVVTLRHRNFCRSCATRFILQKFKRQMGLLTTFFGEMKREGKGNLERILVISEGRASAEALVEMLGIYYVEAQEKNAEKVLPFVNILDTTVEKESTLKASKLSWMEYTKFDIESASTRERISLTFDKGRILKSSLVQNKAPSWDRILRSFQADSRGEARSILLNKMITIYAKQNNYDLILYCDTATKIASKVLALTSQGRGFSLPWECGSLLKRNDIYVARPLKDLSDTEISAYLTINSTPTNTTPSTLPITTEPKPATIDEMMSQYISGLESSFPSIVATTGHTAEKLDLPDDAEGMCLVCSMPKQGDNVKKWFDDITVTQAAPQQQEKRQQGDREEGEGEKRADVTGEVCYGCYTLFRASRGIVEWPI